MNLELKARRRTYLLLGTMVFFSSIGNVLLSKGMKQVGEVVDFSPVALLAVFLKTFMNSSIWLGIFSLLLFFVSLLAVAFMGRPELRPAGFRHRLCDGGAARICTSGRIRLADAMDRRTVYLWWCSIGRWNESKHDAGVIDRANDLFHFDCRVERHCR